MTTTGHLVPDIIGHVQLGHWTDISLSIERVSSPIVQSLQNCNSKPGSTNPAEIPRPRKLVAAPQYSSQFLSRSGRIAGLKVQR